LNQDLDCLIFLGSTDQVGLGPLGLSRYRDHTRIHHIDRNPLDERSARRTELYLSVHNTQKKESFMSPTEFEPAIPANERSQTYALDRAIGGIGF
jgi:hypothetical protein